MKIVTVTIKQNTSSTIVGEYILSLLASGVDAVVVKDERQ